MKRTFARLPDLKDRIRSGEPPPLATGWFALSKDGVAVPTLDDARRCALVGGIPHAACSPRVLRFDPPHATVIIGRGEGTLTVVVEIDPAFPDDETPVLVVRTVGLAPVTLEIPGTVEGACRNRLVFIWDFEEAENGPYDLFVQGIESDTVRLFLDGGEAPTSDVDPCALTISPGSRRVGISVTTAPAEFPRPPLIAVDTHGCAVEAWSVDAAGRILVPRELDQVDLLQSCRGGLIATLSPGSEVRDAIFWQDVIAVLTSSEVRLFDLVGCSIEPDPLVSGLLNAVALAVTEQGFLMVVQRGSVSTDPNVRVFRRDGTEVLAPATFAGRGAYAALRSPAFVFDLALCDYVLDGSRVSSDCCATPARPLTADESLIFRLIDDLRDFRKRIAFAPSGVVILGPAEPTDPLDSGRPETQWHRVLLFGDIPDGCGVRIETRASNDLLAVDPLVPNGWSLPVLATRSSALPVRSPGDVRVAAADAIVLAGPGRYVSLRLTLLSNGIATPRITSIEVERPRIGIGRFLPEVFQNSTPEDDFLRRWLAVFENTTFDGVTIRMDEYSELFDPRTAPVQMLPFLAGWLEILEVARFQNDVNAFRRALVEASRLAERRGTIDGLVLAVELYMGIRVQIVESFKTRSGFILDAGEPIDETAGAVLGCQTILTLEKSPIWLGDEPRLGCAFLLECEERTGNLPYQFDVIVPAHVVCTSADLALLRLIIDTEKPAHTTYQIRLVGAAGWVVGAQSIVGQQTNAAFDRNELDPATFGLAVLNGPPRPKPISAGFTLGRDSRLFVAPGTAALRVAAAVGQTTEITF